MRSRYKDEGGVDVGCNGELNFLPDTLAVFAMRTNRVGIRTLAFLFTLRAILRTSLVRAHDDGELKKYFPGHCPGA